MRLEENSKTFFLKEEHITELQKLSLVFPINNDELWMALKVIISSRSFTPGLYELVGDVWAKVENMY